MKKTALIIALAGLVLASFAQGYGQMEGQMMGQEQMMGKEGKGPMGGMQSDFGMMGAMRSGQMIATSDGGVIVMMGNKLYKYDKDLNLKKEVEIKIDMKGMPGSKPSR